MIVPQYWAEGRIRHRYKDHNQRDRQVTVRRFGWSDTGEADAQAMADARAQEALDRILAGEKLARYEPKVPYNGAEGVPIREEIVSRNGRSVVTRNLYGALCLNTPDVMFVDIDLDDNPGPSLGCLWPSLAVLGAAYLSYAEGSVFPLFAMSALLFVLAKVVLPAAKRRRERKLGSPALRAQRRIEAFSEAHPDLHLRVYETPAGFRIIVMNDLFDPAAEGTAELFALLGTDPMYVRMCRRQRCFRARVSPKPWRIGITDHLRPRPGVWPVRPERLPERKRWVDDYEHRAAGFASCRFLKALGASRVHPDAETVRRLHDGLARAESALPIA